MTTDAGSDDQDVPTDVETGADVQADARQDATGAQRAVADARRDWLRWHEQRTGTVSAPYGVLSVTGTHWIADAEDGRLPGVPGEWYEAEGGDAVLLRASVADGVAVDGELLVDEVRLGEDAGRPEDSRVSYSERRLVLMRREGAWAVRVFDPASAARRAFGGIEVFPYDPEWVRPGVFRPYEEGRRSILVGNADGAERGLSLAGELRFTAPGSSGGGGAEHALQVARYEDGTLWAVLADGTSGRSSYRFRFLYVAPPGRSGGGAGGGSEGEVSVDFNRTVLPPCAFSDHFLCPFPPPGNTLAVDVAAGEREVAVS
ncbi:DUF1684 domain-containing protein [Streptomyces sp. ODS28]|uniref:DUF1684 domain-containing protein n=1 Tax=Streptomyces sp. ODS28 TaxID=3136688 RepID=UPI0031E80615